METRPDTRLALPAEIETAPKRNHNGSIEEGSAMPVTITLKNIPEPLYEKLKEAAAKNRRSLNGEVIARLESSTDETRELTRGERLEAVARVREMLRGRALDLGLVEAFKREGRP